MGERIHPADDAEHVDQLVSTKTELKDLNQTQYSDYWTVTWSRLLLLLPWPRVSLEPDLKREMSLQPKIKKNERSEIKMMNYSRGWEPRLTSNIDGEEHYEEDGGLSCSQHVERLEWEWKSSSWWARHMVLSSGRHSLWLGWQSRLVMCYISAVRPPGGELCKSVQSVHLSAALGPQPRPRQHWISDFHNDMYFILSKGKNFLLLQCILNDFLLNL